MILLDHKRHFILLQHSVMPVSDFVGKERNGKKRKGATRKLETVKYRSGENKAAPKEIFRALCDLRVTIDKGDLHLLDILDHDTSPKQSWESKCLTHARDGWLWKTPDEMWGRAENYCKVIRQENVQKGTGCLRLIFLRDTLPVRHGGKSQATGPGECQTINSEGQTIPV